MNLGKSLALAASTGILLAVTPLAACGGGNESTTTPKNASDPGATTEKASCGAGHTDDKSHCSGSAAAADGGK
jgi:hypothetical protein